MARTKGIFYDGISSNPQEVSIFLNKETAFLEFDTPFTRNIGWDLRHIEVEKIGSAIELKSGSNSLEILKIDDPAFIDAFNKLRKARGYVGLYQRMIAWGVGIHALLALVILGFITVVYVYVLPWVAEKAVVLIPESYENTIGETFFAQYEDYTSIDSAKSEALTLFAAQLKLNNTKRINFTVINSETVNAFALPDGNIVVFTGIIDLMKDYDELAGLLGHEVAHVNNRHSMRMMCRNLAGYIFLSAVLSDVNGIMAVIGDNIHSLQSLTYSRKFEHEADEEGLEMLVANRIDPKGMSKLFTRLQTDHENYIPEFLSSHPVTKDRIEFIDETIAQSNSDIAENGELEKLFRLIKD